MNIESSANFLIGALLTGFGAIVITIAAVVINNIFSKYWKPVKWSVYHFGSGNPPPRFLDETEQELPKSVDKKTN